MWFIMNHFPNLKVRYEFVDRNGYKYPVGLPGLHITMPLVRGVICASISSMAGSAKPFSMLEVTGTTRTPAVTAKLL
jgi:hypothetical protein